MVDNVTMVVPCMGRLGFLKQSMPALVEQTSVLVVDYSDPDQSGQWALDYAIRHGYDHARLGVKFVYGETSFNMSKALNMATREVMTTWVGYINADTVAQPGLMPAVAAAGQDNRYVCFGPDRDGLVGIGYAGFVVCRKSDWESVEGFIEGLSGWGGDDSSFKTKLNLLGLKPMHLDKKLLRHIDHMPERRTQFYAEKDWTKSDKENAARIDAAIADFKARKGL